MHAFQSCKTNSNTGGPALFSAQITTTVTEQKYD